MMIEIKHGLYCLLYLEIQLGIAFEIDGKYDVVKITTTPTYGNEIFSTTSRSKLDCVTTCSKVSDCKSAVYVTSSKMCTLNDEVTDVSSILCTSTTCSTYYVGKQSTMNSACQSSVECSEDNSECRGNQCVCLPGYSYDANTLACVTSCTSYGNTFQEDVGHILQGGSSNHATETHENKSLAECQELCINETLFTCKSVEYDFSISKCFLQQYTLFDYPDRYIAASNYIMYTRNCA